MPACSPCQCRAQVPATYPVPPKLNEVVHHQPLSRINPRVISIPFQRPLCLSQLPNTLDNHPAYDVPSLHTASNHAIILAHPSTHAKSKYRFPKSKDQVPKEGHDLPSGDRHPTNASDAPNAPHPHTFLVRSAARCLCMAVWLDVHVHGPTTPVVSRQSSSATPPDSHPLVHIGTWGTSSGTPGRPRLTYQDGEIGDRELTVKHGHDDGTLCQTRRH